MDTTTTTAAELVREAYRALPADVDAEVLRDDAARVLRVAGEYLALAEDDGAADGSGLPGWSWATYPDQGAWERGETATVDGCEQGREDRVRAEIAAWAARVIDGQLLDSAQVAELLGVRPETIARYRSRGELPAPDVTLGRSPGWYRATITAWRAQRPGRGAGGGRPVSRSGESGPRC